MARTKYGEYLEKQGVPKEEAEAREQFVPTKGEMIEAIAEARNKNPNRKKIYKPDFSLSKEYMALEKEKEKAEKDEDWKLAQSISKQMVSIKIRGTVTDEERQAEIDKTLDMPISDILKERKKYEKIILDCEEKIDNFDVSPVQAKVDALEKEYQKKARANAGRWAVLDHIQNEYDKEVYALEKELIKIPMNELAIRRYEAMEFYLIYESRVKFYVAANKELIEEEIQNAKRMEVRGSLAELVEYMEEG